ncbi:MULTISPECIES: glycerophosphodiester phosphodiesterase [unclassified Moraxella]|uniref:glycerophosphodiester phosphodiesterase n=1 Tax=unclassified Moraxella TaxID=2685852 RepID=UPI003AF8E2B3
MESKKNTAYLLGHRGARAEWLENSQMGFEYVQTLQNQGLDGVEFDVQMTADGEFVVVHDETLRRLVGEQSWVMDKDLAELGRFKQSDNARFQATFDKKFWGQPILSLQDLLPYLHGYRHIELEIKTHAKTNPQALVKNLLDLLLNKKLSNTDWQNLPITLTSFDTDILVELQNQQQFNAVKFPIGLLLEHNAPLASQIKFLPLPNPQGKKLINDTFNFACQLGCVQVGVYYALITPKMVETAHRFELKVTAWTVNDIEVAKKLINMGVDCVITDFPTEFLSSF